MKIVFLDHSGYLVELEKSVLLFDYYKGEIPEISGKKWYVFASHFHEDHFNSNIFSLRERGIDVSFILSKDIKKHRKRNLSMPYELVSWNETYKIKDLNLYTLKSTDEGCAFLVEVEGKFIYHSGDLHWWHWIGESEADNQAMETAFKTQIKQLREILEKKIDKKEHLVNFDLETSKQKEEKGQEIVEIDLAFYPLDPRQEAAYALGMNYFMEHIPCKKVFPMHMWGQYDICQKYLQSEEGKKYKNRFQIVEKNGQEFDCL